MITVGVEYRDVDPEGLVETYKDNPDHLAELIERSPEGGFSDEGVSLHVAETEGGHEYLRFDVFDDEPHYHYIHRPGAGDGTTGVVNNVIDFDVVAHGDMLTWALERIRTRLPEMLTEAGAVHLVADLDQGAVRSAVDQVGEDGPPGPDRRPGTARPIRRDGTGGSDVTRSAERDHHRREADRRHRRRGPAGWTCPTSSTAPRWGCCAGPCSTIWCCSSATRR